LPTQGEYIALMPAASQELAAGCWACQLPAPERHMMRGWPAAKQTGGHPFDD